MKILYWHGEVQKKLWCKKYQAVSNDKYEIDYLYEVPLSENGPRIKPITKKRKLITEENIKNVEDTPRKKKRRIMTSTENLNVSTIQMHENIEEVNNEVNNKNIEGNKNNEVNNKNIEDNKNNEDNVNNEDNKNNEVNLLIKSLLDEETKLEFEGLPKTPKQILQYIYQIKIVSQLLLITLKSFMLH